MRKDRVVDNLYMNFEKDYIKLLEVIASNIKRLRLKKGLTQEDMTDYGFNYRHYQKIESGKYSINLKTAYKLSKVFEVHITGLFK